MRIENPSTFVSTSHVSNNEYKNISQEKEEIIKQYSSQEKEVEKVSKEKLQSAVDSINKFLEPSYTSLKFKLHEDLNEYFVQVVDSNSNEVIREIPSKKLLDVYAAMKELVGFVVDKKV